MKYGDPVSATRWKALFLSMKPLDPTRVALAVLGQLDGYGTEYGYEDENTDAASLVNAVNALMDIKIEGELVAAGIMKGDTK